METTTSKNFSWQLLIRYILGMIMMAYGMIKILQIQFILPSEVYDYELRKLDGVTMAWAFLGFSSWFSILLGLFELIPGFLLLFRRTKLLGAILLFPSLLTVFLINNAYGFLPHMRMFTGVLLLMNLLLLYPSHKLLIRFFKETLYQSPVSFTEIVINFLILGLVMVLIIYNF